MNGNKRTAVAFSINQTTHKRISEFCKQHTIPIDAFYRVAASHFYAAIIFAEPARKQNLINELKTP